MSYLTTEAVWAVSSFLDFFQNKVCSLLLILSDDLKHLWKVSALAFGHVCATPSPYVCLSAIKLACAAGKGQPAGRNQLVRTLPGWTPPQAWGECILAPDVVTAPQCAPGNSLGLRCPGKLCYWPCPASKRIQLFHSLTNLATACITERGKHPAFAQRLQTRTKTDLFSSVALFCVGLKRNGLRPALRWQWQCLDFGRALWVKQR